MKTIHLTPGEVAFAYSMAHTMIQANLAQHIKEQIRSKTKTPFEIQILGAMAEIAFAKWQRVLPNLDLHVRSKSYDFDWMGQRLDVKTTTNPNAELMVGASTPKSKADLYAFSITKLNAVQFIGFCTAEQLINPDRLIELTNGSTVYCMPRDELTPFEDQDEPVTETADEGDGFP